MGRERTLRAALLHAWHVSACVQWQQLCHGSLVCGMQEQRSGRHSLLMAPGSRQLTWMLRWGRREAGGAIVHDRLIARRIPAAPAAHPHPPHFSLPHATASDLDSGSRAPLDAQ